MVLLEFPNEIVYLIGCHLDEPSDMNALCLTNKSLNKMFTPVLYRKDSAHKQKALYWAAENGRVDTAKLCLAAGADVNLQVQRTLDVVGVQSLVQMRTSMDTPLHAAARNGRNSMIRLLFANGAQPNLQNAFGFTPLHECDFNNANTVKILIENGCKFHPEDDNGCSNHTLLHAIKRGADCEALQFLCYGGATEDMDEIVLILQSSYSNNLAALKFFHERAVNMEVTPRPYRSPPLAIAVEKGHFGIVKWMLGVGVKVTDEVQAHIRERMFPSQIPLSYPVWKLLVDHGMDVNTVCPRRGITLLMGTKHSLGDAKKLLKVGADPNITSREDRTVLHYMAHWSNIDHVKLLLSNGAKVDITDVNGWNALHFACIGGSLEVINLLLDHGIDMQHADKHGLTPLHVACARRNTDAKKLLIERGADQAVKCKNGLTADEMRDKIDKGECGLMWSNGDEISV